MPAGDAVGGDRSTRVRCYDPAPSQTLTAVGASVQAPADATVVDGTGKWVTPGIIDAHSHLGVYPSPGVDANDGNEMTDPDTAQVWAEHSVWPHRFW
jgi:imidazolonepropionase-like amidohydrolase